MFNLFDILQAQGGAGMQALGQQYGLSPEQSRRAVEALLPALTIGLQRNAAADPTGFARLFGFAGAGMGADSPSGARAPQPDLLLGQLFGSPAVSQAVLQQASAASGIGTQALRQFLPAMAGMIVAGIVHILLNQPAAATPAAPTSRQAYPTTVGFPAADLWNEWIAGFLTAAGGTRGASADAGPAPSAGSAPPRPRAAPRAVSASGRPEDGSAGRGIEGDRREGDGAAVSDVFQHMFQTGIDVQERNVRAMQAIFDSVWTRRDAADGDGSDERGRDPIRRG